MGLSDAILFAGAGDGTRIVTQSPITEDKFRGFVVDSETAAIQGLLGVRINDAGDEVIEDCLDHHVQNSDYTTINRGTVVKVRAPYIYFKTVWFGTTDQLNIVF